MLYTITGWDDYLFESVVYSDLTKERAIFMWQRLLKHTLISDLKLSLQIDTHNKDIEEVLN